MAWLEGIQQPEGEHHVGHFFIGDGGMVASTTCPSSTVGTPRSGSQVGLERQGDVLDFDVDSAVDAIFSGFQQVQLGDLLQEVRGSEGEGGG